MAIFRLEAKVFSREKRGRSVIAAAAYRAGTKLKDEIRDKIFDYARRTKGVIQSDIHEVVERIRVAGGKTVRPVYPEGDLWVATFRDPAGNIVGVWQRQIH